MSLEKLALAPRKPIEFELNDVARSVSRGGRTFYQASFLEQTENLNDSKAPLHGLIKRLVDGVVAELARDASVRQQPFERITPLDEKGHMYLDALSMHPSLDIKTFQRLIEPLPEIERRIKAMYFNSLANEPNTANSDGKKILYFNRLSFLAAYLPKIINDTLDAKKVSQESEQSYAVRRTLAGIFTNMLNNVWSDGKFYGEVRAKLGAHPQPYLNAAANEFVLSGLDPLSPTAVRHGLQHANPYSITPGAYATIASVMKVLMGEKHESILSNPGNIDRILGNPELKIPRDNEAVQQILKEIKDLSAIVAQVQTVNISKNWIRRQIASRYNDELRGYLTNMQSVEKLVKDDRKTLYQRLGVTDESARKMLDADMSAAEKSALDIALTGYAKLVTNLASARELRRIVDKNVEILMPQGEKMHDETNEEGIVGRFNIGKLYVFAEKGPVLAGNMQAGDSAAGSPAIMIPGDQQIAEFIDIRGFTDIMNKYGAKSIGSYVHQFMKDVGQAAVDHGASKIKYAGDAVIALFSGDSKVRNCMATAGMVQSLLQSHNRAAKANDDIEFDIGIGITLGDTVPLPGLPAPKGEPPQEDFYGTHINLGARLSGTYHKDVAAMLKKMAYRPLDEKALDAVNKDKTLVEMLSVRKPDSHIRKAIVLEDGTYHSEGIILTGQVVDALRGEANLQSKDIYFSTDEEDAFVNSYFDPDKIDNVPILPLNPQMKVEYFFDTASKKPMVLWKHPHELKPKGFNEPLTIYELLPFTSFVYSRLPNA